MFDSYDLWETPVITPELALKITKDILPSQQFIENKNCYLLKLKREPDEDLYYCTMLDKEKGCKLGDQKPFDCRIWPFRIMELDGHRVIALSPVCKTMFSKSIESLTEYAKKLSQEIFKYADRYPEIVKKYNNSYPILLVE